MTAQEYDAADCPECALNRAAVILDDATAALSDNRQLDAAACLDQLAGVLAGLRQITLAGPGDRHPT
jgi:hypothetical protein